MTDEMRVNRIKRFLTHAAIIIGAIIVLCAGIWTCASVICTARLNAEIKLWTEAGLPLTIEDAAPPQVPSKQNAAPAYMQALEIAPNHLPQNQSPNMRGPFKSISQQDTERLSRVIEGDFTAADIVHAREILARREVDSALRGCASASAFPQCVFPTTLADISATHFPYLRALRNAARLASTKAVIYAYDGDADDAIYWITIAFHISNHLSNAPSLFAQLVANASQNTTAAAFTHIAATISPTASTYPQLDATLAATDTKNAFVTGVRMEAALWLSFYASLSEGGPNAREFTQKFSEMNKSGVLMKLVHTQTALFRPLLFADQVAYMRTMRGQYTAITKPWYLTKNEFTRLNDELDRIPRFYVAHMQPAMNNATFKRDIARARIDMARLILALNTYHDAHNTYPHSLADLQRTLDWTIPVDPFSGDTYAYQPTKTSFILYSLGPDGDDDNAKPLPLSVTPSADGDIVTFPLK